MIESNKEKKFYLVIWRDLFAILATLLKFLTTRLFYWKSVKCERLDGKVIVIVNHDDTSLAKALCAELLQQNCTVWATKYSSKKAGPVELEKASNYYEYQLDTGKYEEMLKFKEKIKSKCGRIDKVITLTPKIDAVNFSDIFENEFLAIAKRTVISYYWAAKVFMDKMVKEKMHFITVAPFVDQKDALYFIRRAIIGFHKSFSLEIYLESNSVETMFVKNRFYRGATKHEHKRLAEDIVMGLKKKLVMIDIKRKGNEENCLKTTLVGLKEAISLQVSDLFPSLGKKKNIAEQVALVTGAGMGIGKQIAINLAKQGCNIAIADINFELAQETAKELEQFEIRAKAYKADISNLDEVEHLKADIQKDFGQVQILVNNAGLMPMGAISIAQVSTVEKTIDVNLFAGILTIKTFLPDMFASKQGHIVAISSVAGIMALPSGVLYCMTKFSTSGLMTTLESELLRKNMKNIQTTVVQPYFVWTRVDLISFIRRNMKSSIIPFVKPEMVGSRVVDAIVHNIRDILIPGLRLPLYFVRFMPVDIIQYFATFVFPKMEDPSSLKNTKNALLY